MIRFLNDQAAGLFRTLSRKTRTCRLWRPGRIWGPTATGVWSPAAGIRSTAAGLWSTTTGVWSPTAATGGVRSADTRAWDAWLRRPDPLRHQEGAHLRLQLCVRPLTALPAPNFLGYACLCALEPCYSPSNAQVSHPCFTKSAGVELCMQLVWSSCSEHYPGAASPTKVFWGWIILVTAFERVHLINSLSSLKPCCGVPEDPAAILQGFELRAGGLHQ